MVVGGLYFHNLSLPSWKETFEKSVCDLWEESEELHLGLLSYSIAIYEKFTDLVE